MATVAWFTALLHATFCAMKLKPTCDTDGTRQCWNPCLVSIEYPAWTTVLAHWMALFWTHA